MRAGIPEMTTRAEQTTIASPVSKDGFGLHTGVECVLRILPAAADAGIVFVGASGAEIPATAEHVVGTERCITLSAGGARVGSVEHLLAALYGTGIDNARIEVEGPEVPSCDGSAKEWVGLLRAAGKRRQGRPRRLLAVHQAVWAGNGSSWALAIPARGLALAVAVDFPGTVVGRQRLWLRLTQQGFAAELAPARTFALAAEVESLRAGGLAKGGGEHNAFAFGPDGYSGPLRFPDEVVRHKALDLVGDLALCGGRIQGHILAARPSHRANLALARALRAALAG